MSDSESLRKVTGDSEALRGELKTAADNLLAISQTLAIVEHKLWKLAVKLEQDDCRRLTVENLPHTADGVLVVPGMRVWRREHVTKLGEEVWGITQGGVRLTHHGDLYASSDLFSTREAAKASTEREESA